MIPLLVFAFVVAAAAPALAIVDMERVSLSSAGVQGSGFSEKPSLSADGRYVAFLSWASNFVPNDTNGNEDVFVRDRLTGTTRRVSVTSNGTQANGSSTGVEISANGRYIAFVSSATNLVPNDTNAVNDAFVYDMADGSVKRVSLAWDGSQGNDVTDSTVAISADGRYIAFASAASNLVPGDTAGKNDVFVRDTLTGTTRIASVATGGLVEGNMGSGGPDISADGRYVVYYSSATNLVANDTNLADDIFLHDFATGVTTRVNLSSTGVQGNDNVWQWPRITPDGRYVAFGSFASNVVPNDTNGKQDVFVHDNSTGTTSRVSVATNGTQGNADSYPHCDISSDGRYTMFTSDASNLVPNDTNGKWDAFVHDRVTGTTERVSVAVGGTQGNDSCFNPVSISSDGRYAAFPSNATNLVPNDTNTAQDVFVAQLTQSASSVSRSPGGSTHTYKRKKHKVSFTLSSVATGDYKRPIAGATIYLQASSNGKTKWKTKYALTTDPTGKAFRNFATRSASKTYYRWYLPATSKWVSTTTSKLKVVVK